jgi:hypothetical protein
MKKTLLFVLMMSLSSWASAERFSDHIHSVDIGKEGQEHLLYLSSGRVVYFDSDEAPYFDPSDFKSGERVEIEVDENLNLKSLTNLPPLNAPQDIEPQTEVKTQDATILPNYKSAKKIFDGMNRSWKSDTECSDRAHVWAYEEWKKNDLYSNKVFLFFTNTYIRQYRFYWWFHVSPYTLVREHGEVVDHVLDRRYTSYPYHMKEWTDIFVRSKKVCQEKTYAHYRSNRNGPEHCFVVKTSMYYRLPLHVRNMEDYGTIKTSFSTSEVNFSYRAFTRRGAK